MLTARKPTGGFSLVELLVGLAVGLFVLTGTLTLFASTSKHQQNLYGAARFEREMREVLGVIADDLRRAGYGGILPSMDNNQNGAITIEDMVFNPFTAAGNDLAVAQKTGEAANSCVTFSYNLDEDSPPLVGACAGCGSLPASFTTSAPFSNANLPYDTDGLEMFGYRLNAARIEARNGVGATDTSFDCDAGTWSALTGPEVQVTALTFALTQTQVEVDKADIADGDDTCAAAGACLCTRELAITLTANLAADSLIQRTLSETVLVRNDKFVRAFDTANPCQE